MSSMRTADRALPDVDLRSTMDLSTALERALDAAVVSMQPLRGGDVAESYRVDLGDGRRVFAKTHRSAPALFFTTEAAGLAWLREPGAIAVPAVLAVSDGDADERDAQLPGARMDRRGRRRARDRVGARDRAWRDCTPRAPRASDARTVARPGVADSRTNPAQPGQASTPRSACSRSLASPPTRRRYHRRRSLRSSVSPGDSTSSADRPSLRRASTATSGPETVSSTRAAGAG